MKISKILYLLFISITYSSIVGCSSNDEKDTETTISLSRNFGIWEGTGVQVGNFSWTIKITLNKNEQFIEYPSLNCGGFLTLLDQTENILLFRETINKNTATCADQGFIELINTSATTMDYKYYWPNSNNTKGDLAATGSLTKKNG